MTEEILGAYPATQPYDLYGLHEQESRPIYKYR